MRFMIAPAVALTVLAAPATAQSLDDVAAGTYQLDRNHAFLTWTVVHNGLSDYTVNFTDFDATLDFNPDEPTASTIEVTINPMGVESNYPGDYKAGHPDSEFDTWNEALSRGDRFLNADQHGEIKFVSSGAEATGETEGTVTGNLTFLGTTRPVTMDVTYNGVTNYPWNGERDTIGFTATTTISRSEFGQSSLANVISDDVVIEFSGEFLQAE
ncbi:MAG: YceI family protein [Pseudomonadota bacterium]|nr:YceI family protein [Pseudomonadota bacterium]